MNILVITNSFLFPSAGRPTAGIFFANLLRRIQKHVNRIVVVTPVAYVPKILKRMPAFSDYSLMPQHGFINGFEVFRPKFLSFRLNRRLWFHAHSACLSAMPLCQSLHRRYHFDLVLGNSLGFTAHLAAAVARAAGLRSLCWAIGSDVHLSPALSEENARLFRHNVRYNDVILTVSDRLRSMILARCPQARHVHTFYRGIDLEGLKEPADRRELRSRLGLAADRTYMLSAGNAETAKGVNEFYEAFKRLAGKHPSLAAIWVGSGTKAPSLRNRAEKDGLADRFTITDRVLRSAVLEYMQSADFMAFPSYAEGLPNVVMEAMAVGLPVVVTDVGGTGEVVIPEVTGLLIPPKDTDSLTGAIRRILKVPQEAADMAARGRQLIHTYFDVDRNARVALSIIEDIAAGMPADKPFPACAGLEPGVLPADVASTRLI